MDLDAKINALEMRYTRRSDIKSAIALTLRCWLAYKVADVSDPRAYLHKANHTALTTQRNNPSDVRLLWLTIFIAIEMDRFTAANEWLDTAMGYKSYFKNNEPWHYAILFFLYAYLEVRQKRAKSAKKHMRVLAETANTPERALMLGMLHLSFYEYDEAYQHLTASYGAGNRSVFLYSALFTYYGTAIKTQGKHALLLPVVYWALEQHADVVDILNVYQDELRVSFAAHSAIGERIYRRFPHPQILREVCINRMLARDYGPEAYAFYKDAEHKQLYMPGFYQFLVKAAYQNRAENIHHYSMVEFLRTSDIDMSLKVYVYHLLLTDPTMTDLVPERKNEILQFCTYCLENDLRGRMVNSLYYFFWVQCNEMRIIGKNVDKAEQYLLDDLTRFEVVFNNPAVQCLYITERERKEMMVCEAENGVAYVTAVNDRFRCLCLDAGRRHILQSQVQIKRMVARAGSSLYRHFFRKGERGFVLLAFLADYFLDRLHAAQESEEATLSMDDVSEAIAVFEAVCADKATSKPFKMQVHVALGSLYYSVSRFKDALACYEKVDENYLDDIYIEQILHVFLQTHEYARAAGLILRKAHCVSDRALFDAVRRLSGEAFATFHPNLTDAAYGLLINSWFDQDLLNIVLTHFNGSQADWQALNRALAVLSISEPRLDEIILRNSIWMHQFDEGVQKTFVCMAANDSDFKHPVIKQFIYYCVYEMLINDQKPLYETIHLLEQAYLAHAADETDEMANELLAYALCHVYLMNGMHTFHSEKILSEAVAMQAERGILFPAFKENRRLASAYIEMNQPFLYRSIPGKNVWLNYKLDHETAYRAQRMNYLRFGLYMTTLALFYNEKLTYYFSEELPTGNITTREYETGNETVYLDEKQNDPFFIINNAIIYEQMFKYDQVEQIITDQVKDVRRVRSALL